MKVERLSITNFRGIGELTLDFDGPQKSTVLVGVNGSGKSTILDCLAKLFAILIGPWPSDEGYSTGFTLWDLKNSCTEGQLELSGLFPGGPRKWTMLLRQDHPGERLDAHWGGDYNLVENWSERQSGIPIYVLYPVNRVVIDVPLEPRQDKAQFSKLDALVDAPGQRRIEFHSFFQWFRAREDVENERIRNDRDYLDSQLHAVRNAIYQLVPGFSNLQVRRTPAPIWWWKRKAKSCSSISSLTGRSASWP